MRRVLDQAKEAGKIFERTRGRGEMSRIAYEVRTRFTKSAFSELRSACVTHGGKMTAPFLELEDLIDAFALRLKDTQGTDALSRAAIVQVGLHDGLLDELAAIEIKATSLRDEALAGLTKVLAVIEATEIPLSATDPAS